MPNVVRAQGYGGSAYRNYAVPYSGYQTYGVPRYAVPAYGGYGAAGGYYSNSWRNPDWHERREWRERREHEWREHREHEWREHERRERGRWDR